MNAYDQFMQSVYKPMREQLVSHGFTQLLTAEDVKEQMDGIEGTALIVINSVCGCAAGQARPAVIEALQELDVQPTHLFTVFAGQDKEATAEMRNYFSEIPPSSPSIALWKDGEIAYFMPREEIESNQVESLQARLVESMKKYVTA